MSIYSSILQDIMDNNAKNHNIPKGLPFPAMISFFFLCFFFLLYLYKVRTSLPSFLDILLSTCFFLLSSISLLSSYEASPISPIFLFFLSFFIFYIFIKFVRGFFYFYNFFFFLSFFLSFFIF